MISGIGILVTGALIGSGDRTDSDATPVTPMDKLSHSVVHVTVVRDADMAMVTGLVLDDQGNVLVPADSVGAGDEVWARCSGGASELVQIVGADAPSNLAVIRLGVPAGSPAVASSAAPEVGVEVVTVHARFGTDLAMRDGTVASAVTSSTAATTEPLFLAEISNRPENGPTPTTTDLSGGFVFDRGGKFVGMTTAAGGTLIASTEASGRAHMSMVEVMPADAALAVANRIIAAA